jgi:hypothetical protein
MAERRIGTVTVVLVGVGTAAALIATLLTLTSAPAAGQEPQEATFRAARTADGAPDLNGVWQAVNTANWDLQDHGQRQGPILELGAAFSVPAGEGVVVGNEIPYQPAALAKKKENAGQWLKLDPEIKCYQPGIPRATYMPYPFQILQSSSAMFIAYEYAGATRNILLKDPGPAPVSSWMGQSVGRWEGDTFVVDVTGLNESTWFDRSGNFHSDALHVVERYTRTAPDVITYEATIEDPGVFTRPWTIRMPLYRRLEANAQLLDFKCVEFVEEMIYGKWRKNPLK